MKVVSVFAVVAINLLFSSCGNYNNKSQSFLYNDVDNTGYKNTNLDDNPTRPFLSSLRPFFLNISSDVPRIEKFITLYPLRSNLAHIGIKNKLLYTISMQKNKAAPILFISAGLGSLANDRIALFLSNIAYKSGYSVVTLPSTTHWSFALAASSDGLVGYLKKDAKDLYKLVSSINNNLIHDYDIKPKQYSLAGYSYGGLDASFLAQEDTLQKKFNFSFVMALNPPLNRDTAIQKVDNYYALGNNWAEYYKFQLMSYATGKYFDISNNPNLSIDDIKLSETQMAWIVGARFREAIAGSIKVAKQLKENKIISTDQAIETNIKDYIYNVVYNEIKSEYNLSLNDIIKNSQLNLAIDNYTNNYQNNKKFILIHSADDFLTFPESSKYLSKFKSKQFIYPTGGHLGALADKKVENQIFNLLKENNL